MHAVDATDTLIGAGSVNEERLWWLLFCLDVSGAADCIVLLQIHSLASFIIWESLLKDADNI